MMQKKKKVVPAPPCECECKQCEIGRHCATKPLCQHLTWRELNLTSRRQTPSKKTD